jgi:hypothetical protein
LPQLDENRVDVARKIVDPPMHVVLECGEPRLRPLDPGLCGPGGVDRNFSQSFGLLAQLAGRFLVQVAQRGPLALYRALESL